jgi:hypothetical protein
MNPQYTLEKVAENFKQWRETRHSNRAATPAYLQAQVAALQTHHKAITIRNSLNISSAALNRWCAAHKSPQESLNCPSFISISPEDLREPETQNKSTILCELPNGVRLSFNEKTLGHTVLMQLFHLKPSV